MEMAIIKEMLKEGEVKTIEWIESKEQIADVLIKEMSKLKQNKNSLLFYNGIINYILKPLTEITHKSY